MIFIFKTVLGRTVTSRYQRIINNYKESDQ